MNENLEPNYFGRLLEVMTDFEIRMYAERLSYKGEPRVAEVLRDELAERNQPGEQPCASDL